MPQAKNKKSNNTKKTTSKEMRIFYAFLLAVLTVLVFLSLCFSVTGVFGEFIKKVLVGLLGVSAYIIPLILFHGIFTLFTKDKSKKIRLCLCVVGVVIISVFAHSVSNSVYMYQTAKFTDLVKTLYSGGLSVSSGGLIGGLISTLFVKLLDKVGTIIVFIALLLADAFFVFVPAIKKVRNVLFPFTKEEVAEAVSEAMPEQNANDKVVQMRAEREAQRELKRQLAEQKKEELKSQREERAKNFAEKADSIDRTNASIDDIPVVIPEEAKDEKSQKVMSALNSAPIIDDDFDSNYINGFADNLKDDFPSEAEIIAPKPKTVEKLDAETITTAIEEELPEKKYVIPDISLLTPDKAGSVKADNESLKNSAQKLIETLENFGVKATVANISRGPSVTRFELIPGVGVRVSKFTNLADDIALALKATAVRIEANASGTGTIGIEVANDKTVSISLRRIISSPEFKKMDSPLTAALGLDIAGNTITIDLAKMPHLLIAGSTGSGKSVCINSIIMSILFKSGPEDVKMLMVDPKQIELDPYNGIPHLTAPVVTDPKKAAGALKWAVGEMLNRYKLFSETSSKNIQSYNEKMVAQGKPKMPYYLIVIDELADLMMSSPHEVEDSICRLAQMARAAGMHLVIATQRPSADVITGLIKTNIPSRIAFAVASQIDSRIILDSMGAEKLLGKGDMLYLPMGKTKPTRIQGCYVSESEIDAVTEFIKLNQNNGYDDNVIQEIEKNAAQQAGNGGSDDAEGDEIPDDPMLNDAIRVVVENGKASTSMLQLKLRLGYARAGRLIDTMEAMGIIGPYEGSKPRKVLITKEQWQERCLAQADD